LVFGIIGAILISVICGIIALGRTKDGRQGGRGMAIAGLALSGAWTLGLIAIISSAVVASRGTVNATDVKVGDCITEVQESTRVLSVRTVTCDQPHKGEVYAVLAMPDGDYPGQSTIDEYKDKCSPELLKYSPSALADPAIGVYVLYPSPETWEQGDHAVTCIATSDTPRTGSVKD
jgi:Septum formation